jgi:phospholipid/cholesterol/gamma-HCH transport system substrate-binding protein
MSRTLSELNRHKGAVVGVVLFTALALTLTATVAGTLRGARPADAITLTAVFRDATGLRPGDDVRVAGVKVGRVEEARIGTGDERGLAVVRLLVDADQELTDDTVAAIDYLNLMGQRYVSLSRPEDAEGSEDSGEAGRLEDGATIPLDRTRPALDLTALFNAFRPIFELLQPADINQLATNIVQVLQGQGPTLESLLSQTATLTQGIDDRDETLAQVVDNVSLVLETTNEHRGDITRLLQGLDSLTAGLAKDRDRVTSVSTPWFDYLAGRSDLLVRAGKAVPQQLDTYLRTLGYGSYLNVYVCTLAGQAPGSPAFDLGVSGDRFSKRCR